MRDRDTHVRIGRAAVISTTRCRRVAHGNILALVGNAMRTVGVLLVAATPLAGCFYLDPINERPGADIERVTPELPYRGDPVEVWAQIYDPDGDRTEADWRVRACTDEGCDPEPFDTGADQYRFSFFSPTHTTDGRPTTRVRIELRVTDAWGARAVPDQTLDLNLANRRPTLTVPEPSGRLWRDAYPVGTPICVTTTASDADDPDDLTWAEPILYPPPGATRDDASFVPVGGCAPPTSPNVATWELVAHVRGAWEVTFGVADPLGETATAGPRAIPVAEDRPPCITVAEPAFPPEGARLVLDGPRRFQVLAVDDDLDLYPAPAADHPYLGAASFRWFLASPASGGAFQRLAVDGNAVELDPGGHAPGDRLALRVEAVDQLDRPLCDGALASCALATACYQRRTWSVEVR
jgi:hypothetical protein